MATPLSEATSVKRHRVLIVDDHPIVRQGLRQLINQEPDLMVCGEATEPQQALEVAGTERPDLVIVDLTLKEGSGLDLIKTLQVQQPELPILVVSMHDEALYAERSLRAGARGYIMKQEATETLLHALRRVLDGEIYVSGRMATRLVRSVVQGRSAEDSPLVRLSDRELEVLQFIGRGLSTRQIADTLHLSIKTVETHRANIMRKLHLGHATELVRYAVHWVNDMRLD
jgi:DNA-binding NarL/FixJ family response regulator